MPNNHLVAEVTGRRGPSILIVVCFLLSSLLIFLVAPTEATMGDVQRILYVHVAVAWCGLASALFMGLCAMMYLVRRQLRWDHWSQAAAEVGWICTTLTLVTGSLWAHEAWATWWTWDPRLTSSLVLWLIYSGIILTRASFEDPHRRARLAGVLTIVAATDVPLVIMATRWFRGVHPVSPEMDWPMRVVLVTTVVLFTVLFVSLMARRQQLLELAERAAELEANVWHARATL